MTDSSAPSVAPTDIPAEPAGGLDARFCEVMDAAPVMIWVSAQDKSCIWFNRPWLSFTGRAMNQELGNGWADGVHPEDFDRCLEIYVGDFDARKPFRMQYRLRRHDGEYRWIDDTGIPRYARDGAFLGYIGSCTDIHEQRETQAELRRRLLEITYLNRRGEAAALASSIAHELNQPLAAILSNAEAALLSLESDPPRLGLVGEILADIRRDLGRAAAAVGQMRSLVARKKYDLQDVDLNEVVKVVRDILAPQALEMGVALTADPAARTLPVRADAIQLQQVVLNLALNGIDAMRTCSTGQRRMVLQTAMVGTSMGEVAVSDSGGGIPVDRRETVFEPFFTTKQTGTGLGLPIARAIVETYGGKLWLDQRGGEGAVFRFSLPLAGPR